MRTLHTMYADSPPSENVKQHPTLSQTPDKTWKGICNDGKKNIILNLKMIVLINKHFSKHFIH